MRRRTKPANPKVEAKSPVARKSLKNEGSRVRDLEKRLAESLERERAKDRALVEALEQQTATAEILRVISSSPSDIQPVFDAIAANAARLCDAVNGLVIRFDGQLLHLAAHHNVNPERLAAVRQAYPRPPSRGALSGRSILTRAVVHVPDVSKDPEYTLPAATTIGYRSVLAVPMIHEGVARGTILVARDVVAPFSDTHIALIQSFADQAVIAIENVRLFKELEARNSELRVALEQQTATSEVLKVISRSTFDLQPVLETLVENVARLAGAEGGLIARFDGEVFRFPAEYGASPEFSEYWRRNVIRPGRGSMIGRAALERRTVHIVDVLADPEFEHYEAQRAGGYRSVLAVPMLRQDDLIGVFFIWRTEVRAFTDKQIDLVATFADQAVIAIENARLLSELQAKNADLTESLDQQTATSEILRVISSSPTDLQPVLDTVAESAARLCEAVDAAIWRRDGDRLLLVAHHGPITVGPIGEFPLPLIRGTVAGRSVLDGRTVHVTDAQTEVDEFPESSENARRMGFRTILSVPLMREGVAIGSIQIRRTEAQRFTDRQVALLETFADQAVIAIENVRLFEELEARNAELTETLAQQMATGEVLRAISRAQTDAQPVFDIIATSARRLCGASYGQVQLYDGELIRLAALENVDPEGAEAIRRAYPLRVGEGNLGGRVIGRRAVVQIPDLLADGAYQYKSTWDASGLRSLLGVPMLRDGEPIGTIAVGRTEPGPFSDSQIDLLRTFADQAVIAIENVRLFTELQERNRAVTQAHAQVSEALEQHTATSEILRVISSSPADVQPVFDTILERATKLCEAQLALLWLHEHGEQFRLAAGHGARPHFLARMKQGLWRFGRPFFRESGPWRIGQFDDVRDSEPYRRGDELWVTTADQEGMRTLLGVPLVKDGHLVGSLAIYRREVRRFTGAHVELIKTFADQAVIAIENVRLFKELQTRNRDLTETLEQQTATSEVLRVISRSTADLQPVLDTVAENAVRLCDAKMAFIFRFDGALLHAAASYNVSPVLREWVASHPIAPGRHAGTARAALERRTIHIHDVRADPEYTYGAADVDPIRTVLGVPMVRMNDLLGVIMIFRHEVRPFTDKQIALMETFADQAVIAIENVRLFNELQARTQDLTRSVDELQALGEVSRAVSSTLDLQTVLDTIVTRAVQLSGAKAGVIYEYDEATQAFERIRGAHQLDDELGAVIRATPIRLGEGVSGKAAALRAPVQVPDVLDEQTYDVARIRAVFERYGYRSLLAVPLLFEQQILGVLTVWRQEPGSFAPEVVNLLQTFATQSVLAIQNARLFREIADKSAQLESASRHKSEFLANMSHELRTPLNAIIGFSEVLAQGMFGPINEKQTEYLRDILESGRHLLSLINDILDLSKIEAGRMELEPADFDLPSAIENALILVRERASRRGIRLVSTIDKVLGMIRGDERKIKQVLLNLLSNALKFTPEGGQIGVAARLHDNRAEVSVSDTGIGIAPADQAAVFEEFRQVGTADKKAEGTGLGLTLSRKFIELHGGNIWVQSEVGRGSTFTFTLPLTLDQQRQ